MSTERTNSPSLGYIVAGVAHRLHLVVCNSLGLWFREKRDSPSTSATSASQADDNGDDSDDEDLTDDIELNPTFSSAINSGGTNGGLNRSLDVSMEVPNTGTAEDVEMCDNSVDEESDYLSTDIVNNWSLDVEEESDPSFFSLEKEHIGALMRKCRSFVKLVNKSSILMNYVNNLKHEFNVRIWLQLDCKSRGNSSYHLISTILAYKKIINKINSEKHDIGFNGKQSKKLSSNELDQSDWKMLELIEFVLHPFVHATKLISGSQYPTTGISYFAVIQIREFLDDSHDNHSYDWKILHPLKKSLSKQIDKYHIKNDEQWELMKVWIFYCASALPIESRFSGPRALRPSRLWVSEASRERRAIELNILELRQQNKLAFDENDDRQV